MKLNINAKELLALYNLLQQVVQAVPEEKAVYGDALQLRQIYDRVRSILLGSLSNKHEDALDPFDAWAKSQQEKIDNLAKANDVIKEATLRPTTPLSEILTDDEDEVPSDLPYPKPRKGPTNPQMPFGKHRGKKR